jgi:hypothetical protein
VTFRASCFPDGRSASHYHVPGESLLSKERFNDWLTKVVDPSYRVAVLVIREYRDADGALKVVSSSADVERPMGRIVATRRGSRLAARHCG